MLPEDEELTVQQQEIAYATFAQIEAAVEHRNNILMSEIKGLRTLESRILLWVMRASSQEDATHAFWEQMLSAIRKANKCNLRCKFCYNYGEMEDIPSCWSGMWEIEVPSFTIKILICCFHLSQTHGCFICIFGAFHGNRRILSGNKEVSRCRYFQHLYTNGTLATEESLKALGEAGLDEIRFNLAASNCSDKVIENMKTAKKYIKSVGIESPMYPKYFKSFLKKKNDILETGPDFINCAELHLNENNICNYFGENMYISRHGYISPIWSRELTFKLMKMADEENWDLVVHDCSNHTKFARGLNLSSRKVGGLEQAITVVSFPEYHMKFFFRTS